MVPEREQFLVWLVFAGVPAALAVGCTLALFCGVGV